MRNIQAERFSAKGTKKRSDYQAKYERPEMILIPKEREQTDTGFVAKGYVGSNFEIVYEILAAGATTATYLHPKKDRVIHVLSGTGNIHTDVVVKFQAGEDITVTSGTKYHLAAETDLYLMIIQPSKYAAHLEVDMSTVVKVDMANRIEDVPNAPVIPVFTRGPSKAAQQLLDLAQKRGDVVASNESIPTPTQSSAPMPSFGEDLAGEPG